MPNSTEGVGGATGERTNRPLKNALRIVDFLLVLIELFSLDVTAEALRANIGSDSKFQVRVVASHRPFFTALHVMQTRSSDENSVCLSVCLSHACIVTKR